MQGIISNPKKNYLCNGYRQKITASKTITPTDISIRQGYQYNIFLRFALYQLIQLLMYNKHN